MLFRIAFLILQLCLFKIISVNITKCNHFHKRLSITKSHGFIAHSDQVYDPNSNCFWILTAKLGLKINIRITQFETECEWDYLYIFDGFSIYSRLIASISGLKNKRDLIDFPDLKSSTNSLAIYFTSDQAYEYHGFNLTYWHGDSCYDPQCSNHGFCNDGKCICFPGWLGKDCELQQTVLCQDPLYQESKFCEENNFTTVKKPERRTVIIQNNPNALLPLVGNVLLYDEIGEMIYSIGGYPFNHNQTSNHNNNHNNDILLPLIFSRSVYSQEWSENLYPTGVPIIGHTAHFYKNKIYIFGGHNPFYISENQAIFANDVLYFPLIFDLIQKTYQMITPPYAEINLNHLNLNNKSVHKNVDGNNMNKNFEMLEPTPVSHHTSHIITTLHTINNNNKEYDNVTQFFTREVKTVLVIFGYNLNKALIRMLQEYHFENDSWTFHTTMKSSTNPISTNDKNMVENSDNPTFVRYMPSGRFGHTSVLYENFDNSSVIYIHGGLSLIEARGHLDIRIEFLHQQSPIDSMLAYYPITKNWQILMPSPSALYMHQSILLPSLTGHAKDRNLILTIGGRELCMASSPQRKNTNNEDKFNKETSKTLNDKENGEDEESTKIRHDCFTNASYIYDTEQNIWYKSVWTKDMGLEPRIQHATLLINNTLHVQGGFDGQWIKGEAVLHFGPLINSCNDILDSFIERLPRDMRVIIDHLIKTQRNAPIRNFTNSSNQTTSINYKNSVEILSTLVTYFEGQLINSTNMTLNYFVPLQSLYTAYIKELYGEQNSNNVSRKKLGNSYAPNLQDNLINFKNLHNNFDQIPINWKKRLLDFCFTSTFFDGRNMGSANNYKIVPSNIDLSPQSNFDFEHFKDTEANNYNSALIDFVDALLHIRMSTDVKTEKANFDNYIDTTALTFFYLESGSQLCSSLIDCYTCLSSRWPCVWCDKIGCISQQLLNLSNENEYVCPLTPRVKRNTLSSNTTSTTSISFISDPSIQVYQKLFEIRNNLLYGGRVGPPPENDDNFSSLFSEKWQTHKNNNFPGFDTNPTLKSTVKPFVNQQNINVRNAKGINDSFVDSIKSASTFKAIKNKLFYFPTASMSPHGKIYLKSELFDPYFYHDPMLTHQEKMRLKTERALPIRTVDQCPIWSRIHCEYYSDCITCQNDPSCLWIFAYGSFHCFTLYTIQDGTIVLYNYLQSMKTSYYDIANLQMSSSNAKKDKKISKESKNEESSNSLKFQKRLYRYCYIGYPCKHYQSCRSCTEQYCLWKHNACWDPYAYAMLQPFGNPFDQFTVASNCPRRDVFYFAPYLDYVYKELKIYYPFSALKRGNVNASKGIDNDELTNDIVQNDYDYISDQKRMEQNNSLPQSYNKTNSSDLPNSKSSTITININTNVNDLMDNLVISIGTHISYLYYIWEHFASSPPTLDIENDRSYNKVNKSTSNLYNNNKNAQNRPKFAKVEPNEKRRSNLFNPYIIGFDNNNSSIRMASAGGIHHNYRYSEAFDKSIGKENQNIDYLIRKYKVDFLDKFGLNKSLPFSPYRHVSHTTAENVGYAKNGMYYNSLLLSSHKTKRKHDNNNKSKNIRKKQTVTDNTASQNMYPYFDTSHHPIELLNELFPLIDEWNELYSNILSPCIFFKSCDECQTNPNCGWCAHESNTGYGVCIPGTYMASESRALILPKSLYEKILNSRIGTLNITSQNENDNLSDELSMYDFQTDMWRFRVFYSNVFEIIQRFLLSNALFGNWLNGEMPFYLTTSPNKNKELLYNNDNNLTFSNQSFSTGVMVKLNLMCPSSLYHYIKCPACTCNGHSHCVHSVSTGAELCKSCRDHTTGPNCGSCAIGYFGEPRNGGMCQPCFCHGHSNICDRNTGDCYCRVKGIIGSQCQMCDESSLYFGNPRLPGGTCYFHLSTDYALTFNMSSPIKDRFYNRMNIINRLDKPDHPYDLKIWCSGVSMPKINISYQKGHSNTIMPIISNQLCNQQFSMEIDSRYFTSGVKNVTFIIHLFHFEAPVIIKVSMSYTPKLDILQFFITFLSCFLFLLFFAALSWKIKQRYDLYRRRQRLFIEMEEMATRPFYSVYVYLESKPPTFYIRKRKRNRPTPIAIEPLLDETSAVLSVIVKLPSTNTDNSHSNSSKLHCASPLTPYGASGLALGCTLVSMGTLNMHPDAMYGLDPSKFDLDAENAKHRVKQLQRARRNFIDNIFYTMQVRRRQFGLAATNRFRSQRTVGRNIRNRFQRNRRTNDHYPYYPHIFSDLYNDSFMNRQQQAAFPFDFHQHNYNYPRHSSAQTTSTSHETRNNLGFRIPRFMRNNPFTSHVRNLSNNYLTGGNDRVRNFLHNILRIRSTSQSFSIPIENSAATHPDNTNNDNIDLTSKNLTYTVQNEGDTFNDSNITVNKTDNQLISDLPQLDSRSELICSKLANTKNSLVKHINAADVKSDPKRNVPLISPGDDKLNSNTLKTPTISKNRSIQNALSEQGLDSNVVTIATKDTSDKYPVDIVV